MNFIYKIFKLNPSDRDSKITIVSGMGMAMNALLAVIKISIGTLTSSIAITSEGINNATDVLTSGLALVGNKLSNKHPDAKHPFGYGRFEYISSLVVATLILITGFEVLTESVKLIFNPTEQTYTYVSIIIIAVTALFKLLYGLYAMKVGKASESNALYGVGLDSRDDSIESILVIISAAIFLIFDFSVDAYAGIIIGLIIIKGGFEVMKETLGDILGRAGDKELASKIYKEVKKTDGVLAAADMMLHSYGPNAYSGSVNVEMDHKLTVGEIYRIIHNLQLRIMHELNVTMVFGIYAVDNDNPEVRQIRKDIGAFMKPNAMIKSFHAVYLDPDTNTIYVDFIVDYKLKDWEGLRADFKEYMNKLYPERPTELVIETEYVNRY